MHLWNHSVDRADALGLVPVVTLPSGSVPQRTLDHCSYLKIGIAAHLSRPLAHSHPSRGPPSPEPLWRPLGGHCSLGLSPLRSCLHWLSPHLLPGLLEPSALTAPSNPEKPLPAAGHPWPPCHELQLPRQALTARLTTPPGDSDVAPACLSRSLWPSSSSFPELPQAPSLDLSPCQRLSPLAPPLAVAQCHVCSDDSGGCFQAGASSAGLTCASPLHSPLWSLRSTPAHRPTPGSRPSTPCPLASPESTVTPVSRGLTSLDAVLSASHGLPAHARFLADGVRPASQPELTFGSLSTLSRCWSSPPPSPPGASYPSPVSVGSTAARPAC